MDLPLACVRQKPSQKEMGWRKRYAAPGGEPDFAPSKSGVYNDGAKSGSPPGLWACHLLLIQLGFASRGLGLVLGVIGYKMFTELSKSSGFERSPHLTHQIEIEVQVMNGDEP
jgi:hypothetical protein